MNYAQMSEPQEKRTEKLSIIRLTPTEKKAIIKEYAAAHYPSKSSFIRAKILDTKYSEYRKKQFEAEIAAGNMITELNRLGNNINQIAKAMNTYKDGKIRKEELQILAINAKLLELFKVETLKNK